MKTLIYHDKDTKATVAGVIQGEFLNFGLALKSPDDNYSRKLGNTIAEGRAKKNPYGCVEIAQMVKTPFNTFFELAPIVLEQKRREVLERITR